MITGCLQKKNGYYYAVLYIKVDGKRKTKWIPTKLPVDGTSERKARKAFDDIRLQYERDEEEKAAKEAEAIAKLNGMNPEALISFSDYMEKWLNNVRPTIARATYYGLRRSEVLGLKWSAISFEKKTISIAHKVIEAEVDGKFVPLGEDVLKTKSSFRTLPLIPAVENLLLEEKERQEMYRRLFKKSYCRDYLDYICVDQTGKLFRPNYVTDHFSWIIEKYDLKKIRFHDLRHTCASLLLNDGISMKQIQIWLGHSTFATTADIYAHLDFSAQEASATTMGGLFTRTEKAKETPVQSA